MKLWKLGFAMLIAATGCLGATTTSLGRQANDTSGDDDGSSASQDDDDATSEADGSSGGNGSGQPCEINPELPVAPCPTGEYCKSTKAGACSSGTCQKLKPTPPPGCGALECGCDGVIRCSGIATSATGVDVHGDSTACNIPCGPSLSCDPTKSFCQHTMGGPKDPDSGAGLDYYSCVNLPSHCFYDPSCKCLESELPDRLCTSDTDGRIYASQLAP